MSLLIAKAAMRIAPSWQLAMMVIAAVAPLATQVAGLTSNRRGERVSCNACRCLPLPTMR